MTIDNVKAKFGYDLFDILHRILNLKVIGNIDIKLYRHLVYKDKTNNNLMHTCQHSYMSLVSFIGIDDSFKINLNSSFKHSYSFVVLCR